MGYLHNEHHFRVALVHQYTSSCAVAMRSNCHLLLLDELFTVSSEVKLNSMTSISFKRPLGMFNMKRELL